MNENCLELSQTEVCEAQSHEAIRSRSSKKVFFWERGTIAHSGKESSVRKAMVWKW